MANANSAAHAFVAQVRKKIGQVLCLYQALVNHGQVGQRHHVIKRIGIGKTLFFFESQPSRSEQLSLDVMGPPAGGGIDELRIG